MEISDTGTGMLLPWYTATLSVQCNPLLESDHQIANGGGPPTWTPAAREGGRLGAPRPAAAGVWMARQHGGAAGGQDHSPSTPSQTLSSAIVGKRPRGELGEHCHRGIGLEHVDVYPDGGASLDVLDDGGGGLTPSGRLRWE